MRSGLPSLARATAELLRQRIAAGRPVDVVHCNDWATALVPTYLRALASETPGCATVRTVLTIHNVAHQGIFAKERLPSIGLGWDAFRVDGIEFYGGINLLKQGIVTADAVTTVSPTYASEIQTQEYGAGSTARSEPAASLWSGSPTESITRSGTLPRTPPSSRRYDAEDFANKTRSKGALQKELGLTRWTPRCL
jgi:starch synthase